MKLKDYVIIGVIVLVISAFYIWVTYFGPESGSIAYVYQDNDIVIEINFEDDSFVLYPQSVDINYPQQTTPVEGEGGDVAFIILGAYVHDGEQTKVYIEIDWDKKAIRIQKDETPRQIGVRRNWYDGTGLPAISLPSKVFIVFKAADDDGIDGVV
ncbi:MAG: hypothetical protein WCZ19_01520 [Acholeplasma sp.]